jgi:hypothetical protein
MKISSTPTNQIQSQRFFPFHIHVKIKTPGNAFDSDSSLLCFRFIAVKKRSGKQDTVPKVVFNQFTGNRRAAVHKFLDRNIP